MCVLLVIVSYGCHKDPSIPDLQPFFRTYQGNGNLVGRDIIAGRDVFIYSGVPLNVSAICGYGTGNNTDEDFFLLFIDKEGNEAARSFIGTAGNDQCWSFVRANDGGYVIAGWTDVNNPGLSNDILIVKTDQYGNQQWSKIYGGTFNDLATHIISTGDGYFVTGIKGGQADENSWLLRLDNNGDTLWTFTHGGNQNDGAMRVCDNSNETYAITGYTNSSGNGSTDGYLLIINDAGTMTAYHPFGTSGYEEPHDIEKLDDGWVITGHAGTTDISTHDVFLQFMNTDGSPGNYFTYGASFHDGSESMVVNRSTIHIAGRSSSYDPAQDIFYLETDLSGNEIGREWIGTPNEDPAFGLHADDSQVLITGYALNPISGFRDLLILRR